MLKGFRFGVRVSSVSLPYEDCSCPKGFIGMVSVNVICPRGTGRRGHVIKPLVVVKFTASLRDRIAFVLYSLKPVYSTGKPLCGLKTLLTLRDFSI